MLQVRKAIEASDMQKRLTGAWVVFAAMLHDQMGHARLRERFIVPVGTVIALPGCALRIDMG